MRLGNLPVITPVKEKGHHHLAEIKLSSKERLERTRKKNCKTCYRTAMKESSQMKAKSIRKITTDYKSSESGVFVKNTTRS